MKRLLVAVAIVSMSSAALAADVTGTYKYKVPGAKGTMTVKPSSTKGSVDVDITTIIGQNDCGLSGTAAVNNNRVHLVNADDGYDVTIAFDGKGGAKVTAKQRGHVCGMNAGYEGKYHK